MGKTVGLVFNEPKFICPHCGNGSGSDGTGVDPYITDSHVGWHCFKC